MTHKARDFLPLTPELLRRVYKDWVGGGLCPAVGDAAVSALPLEARGRPEAGLVWERTRDALRRLYEASEGPWELDGQGYLVRFGHPLLLISELRAGISARRACLLRMADWLEALEEGEG